jgi:DNA-binding response OmpR family regulator
MHRILVVDDDQTNTKLLRFLLTDEGYDVTAFNSPAEAMRAISEEEVFDLFILDVMMPGIDGFDMCQRIRSTSTAPIIFISALHEAKDKVAGLAAGGDDYISKPFDPTEVLARVWAAIRRTQQLANSESNLKTLDLALDPVDNKVTLLRTGKVVRLTPIETRLLRCLLSNPGRSLTRDTLMIKVWGYEYQGESNQLDVYIKRLRTKIEENSSDPQLLLTIRGVGYKYQPGQVRPRPGDKLTSRPSA